MDRPLRVLVALNEPEAAREIRLLLSSPKFSIEFASSADDCIRLVERRAGACDLVLLDEELPEFGGIEAMRRLQVALPDLPVALMSAYLNPKFLFAASQAGARGFLNKPIRLSDL